MNVRLATGVRRGKWCRPLIPSRLDGKVLNAWLELLHLQLSGFYSEEACSMIRRVQCLCFDRSAH